MARKRFVWKPFLLPFCCPGTGVLQSNHATKNHTIPIPSQDTLLLTSYSKWFCSQVVHDACGAVPSTFEIPATISSSTSCGSSLPGTTVHPFFVPTLFLVLLANARYHLPRQHFFPITNWAGFNQNRISIYERITSKCSQNDEIQHGAVRAWCCQSKKISTVVQVYFGAAVWCCRSVAEALLALVPYLHPAMLHLWLSDM